MASAENNDMAINDISISSVAFGAPDLLARLHELRDEPERYNALPFGLVVMDLDGTVVVYNDAEARLAGISADVVIGLEFFTDVAPCTNNYLVAGRFDEEEQLDATIDYVFTVKMKPTRVRLRMIKDEPAGRQYLAVQWS